MLTMLTKTNQGLAEITEPIPGCWVRAVDPDPEEAELLACRLGVPPHFVHSALDLDELARTDRDEDAKLIILRVPHFFGEDVDIPYRTIPLGIVLVDEYIVTISKYRTGVVEKLVRLGDGAIAPAKRNRLILLILLESAKRYLEYLRIIKQGIETAEDRLHQSLRNRELIALLKYQKSLEYFTAGLKSNELMMQRLQRSFIFDMYPEDKDLLEDVLTENMQASEMTYLESNILGQMMDAFASVISNNLNVVMKFLASFTIILTFPSLIASLYGMNVPLPGMRSSMAFVLILLVSSAISFLVGYVFWRRDWL